MDIAAIKTGKSDFIRKIIHFLRNVIRAIASFRPANLLSEDIRYEIRFHRSFIPELYKRHTSAKTANCLFCRHLTKSIYHRYCLICSKGTYDNCYLPFPDILYEDLAAPDGNHGMLRPWYFMKPCGSFERLPKNQYSRNLHFILSSISIHNHETLEGLENGLVYGIRPCHICACSDYDLYSRCKKQGECDMDSPCPKIKNELEYIYGNSRSAIRPAG